MEGCSRSMIYTLHLVPSLLLGYRGRFRHRESPMRVYCPYLIEEVQQDVKHMMGEDSRPIPLITYDRTLP